jgi:hypothetical protein
MDYNRELVYGIVMEMIMFKTAIVLQGFGNLAGCPRKKCFFFILNKELLCVQGIKNP